MGPLDLALPLQPDQIAADGSFRNSQDLTQRGAAHDLMALEELSDPMAPLCRDKRLADLHSTLR
jgi:hypothetical protein